MTINNNTIKNFDRDNGLGTISFSADLVASIIKKVFHPYPHYGYISHSITPVEGHDSYYEVSILVKTPTRDIYMREIERLEKEMATILKTALSLNCVIFLNINYAK